ncbi:MAG: PKD domain-containing protein [Gammaproteobacteria bacterium]
MKEFAALVCCLLLLGANAQAQQCNALTPTISGTAAGETINGTAGDDVIDAGGGNDIVNGMGGNDTICGGEGNDQLGGGDGDDQVFGGAGDDMLFGDADDDVLEGGAGIDSCDGTTGVDSAASSCESVVNVDVEIIPVTLFADDGTPLDGELYRPFDDAGPGIGVRKLAVVVSHGAMGSFANSVPKLWGLYGAPRGFTVLALNRRDWGSTGGGGAVLFEPTTLDIGPGVNLLSAIGIDEVFVTGHSQGTQNAALYPILSGDQRVSAVGLYGTVADGRATARDLLFSACPIICYDDNVVLAQQLVAGGQGDVVIGWDTIFGQQVFRSPNNFLSFWGPDSLSVVVREITNLQIPALLMLTTGDGFTPAIMSQQVLNAGLAAGTDVTFTSLPQPPGYIVGAQGGNAHGFVATERAMVAETMAWLTPRVLAMSETAVGLQFPQRQPDGNYSPVADAGPDASSPALGPDVTLDATNSVDVDGQIDVYAWMQLSGDPVDLDDLTSATPSFPPPATPQTMSFQVTVTDDDNADATSTVDITILNRVGDGNGDGVVDYLDLNEVFVRLNTPADEPYDPLDIDENGTINVLDLRRLSFLCDAYGCGFTW